MKHPQIFIEHTGTSTAQMVGHNTRVWLIRFDEEDNEERIDISGCVRAADVRLAVGEILTAKLECLITGVETRAEVEEALLRVFQRPPRRWWHRFLPRQWARRDVTTLTERARVYV